MHGVGVFHNVKVHDADHQEFYVNVTISAAKTGRKSYHQCEN
jgi:hypothetical protein